MNFDFSTDQKDLQGTVRSALEEHCPLTLTREVLETSAPYSVDLWNTASELGWLGAAVPEEFGGTGLGYLELCLVAEEFGRALAPVPFSSSVCLFTEAVLQLGDDSQRRSLLPRLASGGLIGTFATTEKIGEVDPNSITTHFADGRLSGIKLAVPDGGVADWAVVLARTDTSQSLVLVDLSAEGVRREEVDSFDGSRPHANLSFENAAGEPLGARGEGWQAMEDLLDRAAVLMAFEQVGAAERSFELTRKYVLDRHVFGRPVASFQAIKHRLADLWVALELARSHAYYGAWALAGDEPELSVAACAARVSATTAFELAATEMIQLHGGVGYTWEYDCHLFYRRSKHLALSLGGVREWRDKLIRRVARSATA